jgi:hypothetical protein
LAIGYALLASTKIQRPSASGNGGSFAFGIAKDQ